MYGETDPVCGFRGQVEQGRRAHTRDGGLTGEVVDSQERWWTHMSSVSQYRVRHG